MRRSIACAALALIAACGGDPGPLPDADDFKSAPNVTAVDRAQDVADLSNERSDMLEELGGAGLP